MSAVILWLAFCLFASPSRAFPASAGDDGPPQAGSTAAAGQPITDEERLHWFVNSTVGPKSLAAGVVSAAWGTAFNVPEENGVHFSGFAWRYGMRLTGVSTGNAIEAGLGRAWNEDPRYFPLGRGTVWERVEHAASMTVMADRGHGDLAPAYARYAGIAGNNFMSNAWRQPSESSVKAALTRTALGFMGRFVSNVFDEFWNDIRGLK